MERIGSFEDIVNKMSTKCTNYRYSQAQTILQLSVSMCTILLFVCSGLGINDERYGVDKNELFLLLTVDVGHSEVSLVCSAPLILEVILELAPRESLEQPFQFEGEYVIVVAKAEHNLHMMPVADTQQQVVINNLPTIKRIVDGDSLYPQWGGISQFMWKDLT